MRIFRAVCDVRNNGLPVGIVTNRITLDRGPLTEDALRKMEQAIRTNPNGTQIPRDYSVTIVNLIELEA